MGRDIVLPTKADLAARDAEDQPLVWSARWSLTTRILAVNIVAIALLAGGFFYLDTYRSRLVDTRVEVMKDQLAMLDEALEAARPDQRTRLIGEFTRANESRLRFYDRDGRRLYDSFDHGPPTYTRRWTAASTGSSAPPIIPISRSRRSTAARPGPKFPKR